MCLFMGHFIKIIINNIFSSVFNKNTQNNFLSVFNKSPLYGSIYVSLYMSLYGLLYGLLYGSSLWVSLRF